jgi:N-methylhydantoinase A/oxoprolinase/acetone carboxylase beta subunit
MDVGVDVGGTFTDFVGFRGRAVVSAKLPSSKDPAEAVLAGMRELGAVGVSHGTTVATKACPRNRDPGRRRLLSSGPRSAVRVAYVHRRA